VVSTIPAIADAAAITPRPSRTSQKEGIRRLTSVGETGGEPSSLQRSALEWSRETRAGALGDKEEKDTDAEGWRLPGPGRVSARREVAVGSWVAAGGELAEPSTTVL
jgi:hypothetical protein